MEQFEVANNELPKLIDPIGQRITDLFDPLSRSDINNNRRWRRIGWRVERAMRGSHSVTETEINCGPETMV